MAVRDWLMPRWGRIVREAFPRTVVRTVSSEDAERWLGSEPPTELLEELRAFGTLLLDEVSLRTSALDAKATSILGWAGAAVAFLVIGSPDWVKTNSWTVAGLTLTAIASASLAALKAWLALRARGWSWPSEVDWFRHVEFEKIERLRSYHLISILNAHRAHDAQNAKKGDHLVTAQWALALAVGLVAVMAILRVLGLFFAFST